MANKLWNAHTVNHYSVRKRNELLITTPTWMNIQGIIPSKKKKSPNYILYDSIDITFLKYKIVEMETDEWLPEVKNEVG